MNKLLAVGVAVFGFIVAITICITAHGAEIDYQIQWCAQANGISVSQLQKGVHYEVPVKGGRIDCMTEREAVEVDYAHKWKECIAQARWYALQTHKSPACLLIVGVGDEKYIDYFYDYLYGWDIYIRLYTVQLKVPTT